MPLAAAGRTRPLPLARLHHAAGWHPAPAHGWTLPLWYEGNGGALEEQIAARSGAVIVDRSHLGRFYVTGERAAEALAHALATDARQLPVGRVARAAACRDDGSVLDLPWLWPLEAGRWLVVSGPRAQERLHSRVTAAVSSMGPSAGAEPEIALHDRLASTVLLSVQGPRSAELLAEVVGPTIPQALAPGACRELLLGGYRAAVARASEIGEDGYWLLASPEVGEQLLASALAAGVVPAGLSAHDALRLEAGVLEAPLELPRPATPGAAGLDALVHLDAGEGLVERDFPGRDALLGERAAGGPERRVTALRLAGRTPARHGAPVLAGGEPAGACIAAAYSAALSAPIALAYLTAEARAQPLAIEIGGRPAPAEALPLPLLPPRAASPAGGR
jgi:aminomethyltransferase